MEIDIRNSSEEIDSIRFASGFGGVNCVAQAIKTLMELLAMKLSHWTM